MSMAGARHGVCELTHGMAGERHGRGMLCVNRPLGSSGVNLSDPHSTQDDNTAYSQQ
jgi:hypothetical protein